MEGWTKGDEVSKRGKEGGGGGFGEGHPGRVRVKESGSELGMEKENQTRRDGGTERAGQREG